MFNEAPNNIAKYRMTRNFDERKTQFSSIDELNVGECLDSRNIDVTKFVKFFFGQNFLSYGNSLIKGFAPNS